MLLLLMVLYTNRSIRSSIRLVLAFLCSPSYILAHSFVLFGPYYLFSCGPLFSRLSGGTRSPLQTTYNVTIRKNEMTLKSLTSTTTIILRINVTYVISITSTHSGRTWQSRVTLKNGKYLQSYPTVAATTTVRHRNVKQ